MKYQKLWDNNSKIQLFKLRKMEVCLNFECRGLRTGWECSVNSGHCEIDRHFSYIKPTKKLKLLLLIFDNHTNMVIGQYTSLSPRSIYNSRCRALFQNSISHSS